ncbi:hypothetical protein CVT24_010046 [Panaeolus cyanescens]|uniref:Uncharacterized protein n=1 Tax=Panaeolus cyanescens TaxID=181874 RepID=A0A409WM55_9AGAR|nr:hypothetical protein CVT24_010046 [Panaeolus cyanescens]
MQDKANKENKTPPPSTQRPRRSRRNVLPAGENDESLPLVEQRRLFMEKRGRLPFYGIGRSPAHLAKYGSNPISKTSPPRASSSKAQPSQPVTPEKPAMALARFKFPDLPSSRVLGTAANPIIIPDSPPPQPFHSHSMKKLKYVLHERNPFELKYMVRNGYWVPINHEDQNALLIKDWRLAEYRRLLPHIERAWVPCMRRLQDQAYTRDRLKFAGLETAVLANRLRLNEVMVQLQQVVRRRQAIRLRQAQLYAQRGAIWAPVFRDLLRLHAAGVFDRRPTTELP